MTTEEDAWEQLRTKYMWVCFWENCPVCESLRGRVYTYDQWYASGVLPGFHYHCNCQLREVSPDTELSDPDFFGCDLDLLLNEKGYFEIVDLHRFRPFPLRMIDLIEETMKTRGLGLKEAMSFIWSSRKKRSGFFFSSGLSDVLMGGQTFTRRVYTTLNIFRTNDTVSGSSGLFPSPDALRAYFPPQSYQAHLPGAR